MLTSIIGNCNVRNVAWLDLSIQGTAIAALVMNVPLLWLTISVKQLDDANYHVVGVMSTVLMDFILLPMGKTELEIHSYNTCLKKMEVRTYALSVSE